ncbi:MAG: hypothetical protein K2Q06_10490 [Parvularculaceae bacterium]|nr:hypothetical protein [Parvularculaceae bacterium]
MREILRRAALVAAFAALSACASSGSAPSRPSADGPRKAADATASTGKPAFRVRDVMGKSPEELDKQFGKPALVRREGQGEFRRYTLKGCELIVILYPDDKGEKIAGHVDAAAKAAGAAKPDVAGCLAAGA